MNTSAISIAYTIHLHDARCILNTHMVRSSHNEREPLHIEKLYLFGEHINIHNYRTVQPSCVCAGIMITEAFFFCQLSRMKLKQKYHWRMFVMNLDCWPRNSIHKNAASTIFPVDSNLYLHFIFWFEADNRRKSYQYRIRLICMVWNWYLMCSHTHTHTSRSCGPSP